MYIPCAGARRSQTEADKIGHRAGGFGVRIPPQGPELNHARGSVPTQRTPAAPPSMHPEDIPGILRFFLGLRRQCGVDVLSMATRTRQTSSTSSLTRPERPDPP